MRTMNTMHTIYVLGLGPQTCTLAAGNRDMRFYIHPHSFLFLNPQVALTMRWVISDFGTA